MKVIKSILIISIFFTIQSFQCAEKRRSEDVSHREDSKSRLLEKLEIRQFSHLDTEKVSTMFKENLEIDFDFGNGWYGYVAYFNNELVGCVFVELLIKGQCINLDYLIVDKKFQNRGIGKALIDFVKYSFPGYKKIKLTSLDDVIDFYKKQKFTVQPQKNIFV